MPGEGPECLHGPAPWEYPISMKAQATIPSATAFALTLATVLWLLPAAAQDMVVYDDAMQNGWTDSWSWGAYDLADTAYVHAGIYSLSCCDTTWEGFYPHLDGGVSGAVYDGLEFWIHGGSSTGQPIQIVFRLGTTTVAEVDVADHLPGGPSNTWQSVRIAFDDVGLGSASFDGFWFWNTGSGDPFPVYLDDIVITERDTPPVPVTVAVDPDAERRPIDPLIYGAYLVDDADPAAPPYPLRRWGGNHTTRYNWQKDVSNRAFDWYFINGAYAVDPGGTRVERFVTDSLFHGAEPLITVPLIGWTPVDRVKRWGFSIAAYGPQEENECTRGSPPWCEEDAGNGVAPDGMTPITGNDPYDTSVPVGPAFVTGWMTDLAATYGDASSGGPRFFALDNEPMLWDSTHRDVHPDAVDYAEMWQRTEDYAAAIKAQDTAAETFGPVVWGWCAYFYSSSDGCTPGSDYTTYGPFLEWYLDQVAAYESTYGVRLVDYLDVHYYPQADGVALSGDESAGTQALRLRSVKGLYDPTYADESWIAQPVRLIPRMREIINNHAPGTKLAITEYNWGNDAGISSALAQVEILGIFGREGVDLASRWVAPAVGTLVEDAFEIYLNYDGAGAQAMGDSVQTISSDVDQVGAYTIRGADDSLYFFFINKATVAHSVDVTVAGGLSGDLTLYGFEESSPLGPLGTAAQGGGVFTVDLPARSALLAVGSIDCPLPGEASSLMAAKDAGEANLTLTWTNATGADDYVVYEDTDPAGAFATQTGTTDDGATGLTVPMPSGLRFYRVAGRNACGEGPLAPGTRAVPTLERAAQER